MPRHVTVFNIGTGHSRAEKYLLFNYLYHSLAASPLDPESWAGIATIGPTKANVTYGGTPNRVVRSVTDLVQANDAVPIKVNNDHWKMINDGATATADFIEKETVVTKDKRKIASGSDVLPISDRAFRLLMAFHEKLPIDQINLVGHSRGCIVSMRIAALLHKHLNGGPDINILLLDPVERTLRGEKDLNITIHENVSNFVQLVMEDEDNTGVFGLSKIHGTALYPDSVILVPGRHGTLTQYNNQPIQTLGYHLITYYLSLWDVPFRNGTEIGTRKDIIKSFFNVVLENPIVKGGKDLRGKLFRQNILDQDDEAFKTGYLKARLEKLEKCGWNNIRKDYDLKYCRDNIFATPSHYDFFMSEYPQFDPMDFETFEIQFRRDMGGGDFCNRVFQSLGKLAYRDLRIQ